MMEGAERTLVRLPICQQDRSITTTCVVAGAGAGAGMGAVIGVGGGGADRAAIGAGG